MLNIKFKVTDKKAIRALVSCRPLFLNQQSSGNIEIARKSKDCLDAIELIMQGAEIDACYAIRLLGQLNGAPFYNRLFRHFKSLIESRSNFTLLEDEHCLMCIPKDKGLRDLLFNPNIKRNQE